MYNEEDFIQLSALQHFLFCPRQCALSYIEQVWAENLLTTEGGIMHDRAHEEAFGMRDGIRVERGMPLRSERLGLNGKADVVEFHKNDHSRWVPFPVEYKHGKPKENDCDCVQLCAQAICLEEAVKITIPAGAIFYGKTRRRKDILFDEILRRKTEETSDRVRFFIKEGKTPSPQYAKRCESCSLIEVCMPKIIGHPAPVEDYLRENIES